MQNLGKSFLSIDTEGRVLRFESAAKFLAPGVCSTHTGDACC
jgi:DNA-binding transcriptional MocR family regulator